MGKLLWLGTTSTSLCDRLRCIDRSCISSLLLIVDLRERVDLGQLLETMKRPWGVVVCNPCIDTGKECVPEQKALMPPEVCGSQ